MSRSVHQDYERYRAPGTPGKGLAHISVVLAETFKVTQAPEDLTAWADAQPMPGQMELPFCTEVNSEFTSNARPGADWGTWA